VAEHGRYRGTVALDVTVPGAVPPLRLLALDARDRGFTLRGTTAPARTPDGTVGRAPMPFWVTLPDMVSTPVTGAGALHATVDLRPDVG
jgi:hypothetical protein